MDTIMIRKIVDESVGIALKAKESQCKLHSERLDKFEDNQDTMIKEIQETNKILAVLVDNTKDLKTDRNDLYKRTNDLDKTITTHEEQIKNTKGRVHDIEETNKAATTLKYTALIALAVAAFELFFKKG